MRSPLSPQTVARPLQHRKSVDGLSEAQLSDFRRAFGEVQALGDERGFAHHAGIHGLPLPMYCQHGNQLFLPWHRAYLYFFELALRDRVPTVSLPWWDWASPSARASGVPQAYAAERAEGESNPLFSFAIPEVARQQGSRLLEGEPPRRTFREPMRPAELPTPEQVEDLLAAPNFLDFNARAENLHNWVHVWIRRTTAEVPWAAYDPLFWAHHAIIDRLWRLWQLRNPETNLDRALLRQALPPFNMIVEDTLDSTALGYEYASSTVQATGGTR